LKSLAFIVLICLLSIALPVGAQEDNDPALVVVNYAEIDETDRQVLRVYFTVVDGLNRAISAPRVSGAQAIFNNQIYNGVVTVPQTPLYLTLVLDTSGSMRTDAALVRQVATEAVNTAPQGTRFSIIQFNEQIITRVGFTDDRSAVIEAINTLTDDQFTGGTCLYDATFDALEAIQAAAPAGRRAVIVFTDGRDELVAGGGLDPCSTRADVARIIETARNPQVRVPIYTIGLSGTQVINQEELATLATSTGGLSAFGGQADLSRLFLQIIQALAAQRQATLETCVPVGQYGGLFNVDTGSGSLNAPLAALNFATTCVIPTFTPSPSPTFTPEPLVLGISSFRFNAESNTIDFDIERGGAGDVSEYRIEIVNRATGFRVQGDYGLLIVPASGDGTVRVPLDQVPALEWVVTVSAYDASGGLLARSAPAELAPERTPTPTYTASSTPTITPTFTPTATPLVPEIAVSSVQFLQDSGEFILNLRLVNITPENAPSYTIRIENAAGIQVASETRMTTPTSRVTVPARDSENDLLPQGEYTLFIEIPTGDSQTPLRATRQVIVPPPPPTATPTPLPSTTDRLVENLSANPSLATGLILLAIAAFAVIIFLAFRFGRRRGDYSRRAFQETFSSPMTGGSPTDVQEMSAEAGAEGILLRVVASPHHVVGREWGYSLATIVREELQFGNGAVTPGMVYINLLDPGVSKLHATIGYEGGQYWIRDEGSTNGTFIDQQRLTGGQRYPLQSGQMVRFGLNTQLEFVTRLQTPQSAEVGPYLVPATELPRGVNARITIVQSPDSNMQGGRTFEITTREFTIGRGASNDLTINAEGVSKVHVTIKYVNHQFVITDQRSTNNTILDGERLAPLVPTPLMTGKEYTILLGQKTRLQFSYHTSNPLPALESTRLVRLPGAPPAPSFPAHEDTVTFVADLELPANLEAVVEMIDRAGGVLGTQTIIVPEVTIGRKSSNVLVFDNPEVSRLHAHIFWREGQFYLEDLDSGNGTFLDGQRLKRREPTELMPGTVHEIRLGRESAAIRFRFRYGAAPLPPVLLQGDEDEPTQVPEE
jgi:VWFA-related protein